MKNDQGSIYVFPPCDFSYHALKAVAPHLNVQETLQDCVLVALTSN